MPTTPARCGTGGFVEGGGAGDGGAAVDVGALAVVGVGVVGVAVATTSEVAGTVVGDVASDAATADEVDVATFTDPLGVAASSEQPAENTANTAKATAAAGREQRHHVPASLDIPTLPSVHGITDIDGSENGRTAKFVPTCSMAKEPPEGCIHVVVEIPRGSRNKYEIDHESGNIFLDRRLFTATTYPADYGFIPDTLGGDGDPLDALVLLEDPVYPGVWVDARPVGVLYMVDEAGNDAKIICVPPREPRWADVYDISDLTPQLVSEIQHFFEVYKALEPGKMSSTGGLAGRTAAWTEIDESRTRHVTEGHGAYRQRLADG